LKRERNTWFVTPTQAGGQIFRVLNILDACLRRNDQRTVEWYIGTWWKSERKEDGFQGRNRVFDPLTDVRGLEKRNKKSKIK